MISYWINELMNLLAGNSRYMYYCRPKKLLFISVAFVFLAISIALFFINQAFQATLKPISRF